MINDTHFQTNDKLISMINVKDSLTSQIRNVGRYSAPAI